MTSKRAWLSFGAVALTACVAVASGCGGKAEIDGPAPNPSGTTDGAGGATTSATTSDTTVGATVGSTGIGGGGPVPDVVASTGDAPPPDASVGTGPATCDFTGDCDTCVECAGNDACANPSEACAQNPACQQYANCVAACTPDATACFEGCAKNVPVGHELYFAFASCVLCPGGACTSDCAKFTYLCGK